MELASQGKRLILDLGLPLDAEENTKDYLPEIKGLDGSDPTLLGILVSHPHQDHFGLIKHASSDIPVGIGKAARRILIAAAPYMLDNWEITRAGWDFESEKSFSIGLFTITPYLVDHSAYDAYALLIEADGKRLFYSGDFRAHGRKSKLFQKMLAAPPNDIDVLMLEGTNIARETDRYLSESDLEPGFIDQFKRTKGLALVQCSAQNIDRVVTVFKAAKASNRNLVIDLYTAEVLRATGGKHIPQSYWNDIVLYVPDRQARRIAWIKKFEDLHRHSRNRIYIEKLAEHPERYALLFRGLHMQDLEDAECLTGASYVYSLWKGYWERGDNDNIKDWLESHHIPVQHLHTSGHATKGDLKRFAEALNPGTVIPIHTFSPEVYSEAFNNTEILEDGTWFELQ